MENQELPEQTEPDNTRVTKGIRLVAFIIVAILVLGLSILGILSVQENQQRQQQSPPSTITPPFEPGRDETKSNIREPNQGNGECVPAGCSGQLCIDAARVEQEGGRVLTTCEFRPEYACLKQAICQRQKDGSCGWTDTPESQTCKENLKSQDPMQIQPE